MGRKQDSGVVRRPVEYVLLAVALLLIIFLVWMIRELRRQEAREAVRVQPVSDSTDISSIVERSIDAEEHIDATYDAWEEKSSSAVDSAADDVGGVYDESSY